MPYDKDRLEHSMDQESYGIRPAMLRPGKWVGWFIESHPEPGLEPERVTVRDSNNHIRFFDTEIEALTAAGDYWEAEHYG